VWDDFTQRFLSYEENVFFHQRLMDMAEQRTKIIIEGVHKRERIEFTLTQ